MTNTIELRILAEAAFSKLKLSDDIVIAGDGVWESEKLFEGEKSEVEMKKTVFYSRGDDNNLAFMFKVKIVGVAVSSAIAIDLSTGEELASV